jgi:hypothetical protein
MTLSGNASAEAFFRNCCIYFCQADRIIGVGDLDVQLYGGYHQEQWLLDLIVGARFPTGKQDKHPGQTLFFPTGNNGHFEFEVGINSGWHPIEWFGIMLKGYYSHVFNHVEKKAAAFAGATVINIGTPVDANVSWNYGFAQLDFNFFHPKNPDLGGSIGYEIYAKQHDKVRFCQDTAVDCLGRTEPLDSCLLERNTNTLTNKIRGEFFNRFYYWELFAGASYIFAGRNAVQEIEGHVGVTVYF